jgi:hypothetical protein
MGNSNSVNINDFQHQLISSCLWSLRQTEIKEYYYKNNNGRLVFDTDLLQLNQQDISQLYKPNLLNITNELYTRTYTNLPVETNPAKNYSKMINDYLYHILETKEEVDILIQEIINKLKPGPTISENDINYMSDDF